jgi:hypothetical protein
MGKKTQLGKIGIKTKENQIKRLWKTNKFGHENIRTWVNPAGQYKMCKLCVMCGKNSHSGNVTGGGGGGGVRNAIKFCG